VNAPSEAHTADTGLDPYRAVLQHAELELELAGRGELGALTALGMRWEQITRDLPPTPPAAAASLLEMALLIHQRTHVELLRLREALQQDMLTSGRARRTAQGYSGSLHPRPRLDASA
jgi:hypothetical protein